MYVCAYSGKCSHGAKFSIFPGDVNWLENTRKNCEIRFLNKQSGFVCALPARCQRGHIGAVVDKARLLPRPQILELRGSVSGKGAGSDVSDRGRRCLCGNAFSKWSRPDVIVCTVVSCGCLMHMHNSSPPHKNVSTTCSSLLHVDTRLCMYM